MHIRVDIAKILAEVWRPLPWSPAPRCIGCGYRCAICMLQRLADMGRLQVVTQPLSAAVGPVLDLEEAEARRAKMRELHGLPPRKKGKKT